MRTYLVPRGPDGRVNWNQVQRERRVWSGANSHPHVSDDIFDQAVIASLTVEYAVKIPRSLSTAGTKS